MEIVRTKGFDRDVERIGLTQTDLSALFAEVSARPDAGDPIKGLKGVRKIRFGFPSRRIGKQGGGRAIYYVLVVEGAAVFLMAYAKNEKDDLSNADRKAVLQALSALTEED